VAQMENFKYGCVLDDIIELMLFFLGVVMVLWLCRNLFLF